MRSLILVLPLLVSAWALEVRLSATLAFDLFPQGVVVERVAEPRGMVVVYNFSRAEAVFRHHDEDLRRRGWVRVKYEVKKGEWKAEYRKGKAKATLSVKDKKGRVEVRLKEGD
ncbi:hypothetical protein TCCBUS3UF1_7600 [Thermus sp. CCB_US3_UF1]|uniref:hypothetical protein n=1 Tax=Thermus sp. CCB_US3_UF1 TaxID=1111069 RepID=UPI000238968B|nr:hypothetical protein [Thermus sp. CCB_US3_UF1]AEV15808.1 hypothetical protein TCCBUS3UF1_7600 [Thermus sp. CCB_US3_UF1]